MNKIMKNTKLNLKCTNLIVSDDTKNRINQKIQSITKFIRLSSESELLFDVEVGKTTTAQHTGEIFRAEINLEYHGKLLRAESTKDNLYSALDSATEEMISLVHKNKDKKHSLFKRGALKVKQLFRSAN